MDWDLLKHLLTLLSNKSKFIMRPSVINNFSSCTYSKPSGKFKCLFGHLGRSLWPLRCFIIQEGYQNLTTWQQMLRKAYGGNSLESAPAAALHDYEGVGIHITIKGLFVNKIGSLA